MEVSVGMVVPKKRPRKASGKAAKAEAARAAAARAAAAEVEEEARWAEFRQQMANPPTPEELRERQESWDKFCSESWERFRDRWIDVWSHGCKIPFEAVTQIPCMHFTDANFRQPRFPYLVLPEDTLQIVSVQVKDLTAGLRWPLHVYGFVAVRDVVDRRRNMIFDRPREDCQTINEQDSYLTLTGPSRGVIMSHDNAHLEVKLKLKGTTESEDKDLNKFVDSYKLGCYLPIEYTSKKNRDIQISLLDLNDDELPLDADGFVKLSRRVICVEKDGKLGLSIFERGADGEKKGQEIAGIWVAAEEAGRATHYMPVDKLDCWMQVTVAWSLFSL